MMKPEDVLKAAYIHVQKSVSPLASDQTKQSAVRAFVAGFTVAQGMWTTYFEKQKEAEAPKLVTATK